MVGALHRYLLVVFGRLPRPVRRALVRLVTPSFTVGAVCVIQRQDGRVALIRQHYRRRWGLPGGLTGRGEHPDQAVSREVREEIGLDIDLLGEPTVVVDPIARRVDVIYRARPRVNDSAVTETDLDALSPASPEILAVGWFAVDALPELQEETVAALEALSRAHPAAMGERDRRPH